MFGIDLRSSHQVLAEIPQTQKCKVAYAKPGGGILTWAVHFIKFLETTYLRLHSKQQNHFLLHSKPAYPTLPRRKYKHVVSRDPAKLCGISSFAFCPRLSILVLCITRIHLRQLTVNAYSQTNETGHSGCVVRSYCPCCYHSGIRYISTNRILGGYQGRSSMS